MILSNVPYWPALGLLVVSVVVGVAVGAVTWRRRPDPGTVPLTALMASLVVWGGTYAVALVVHDESTRLALERVLWIGVATAPVAWIAFALEYTGHARWLTRRTVGLLVVIPAVTFVLVLTNQYHGLVWAQTEVEIVGGLALAVQRYGPLFWVFAVYGYGLILVGAGLLIRLVFTAGTLYADQAGALVLGALVPTVANLASVLGVAPIPGLDMTPYAIAVAGLAFAYALVRFRLFDLVPATRHLGRGTVIDNMRDGVVIVDEAERIVDVNPAAKAAFAVEDETVLGEPLAALLGEPVAVPGPEETREVTAEGGGQTYEMTAAPIVDWQDRQVGNVLVLRDVTERARREQRLSVLNRVLRHNLRNDANVLYGRADLLLESLDGTDADHAELIREKAMELSELGEKARTIDRVVGDDRTWETVDLVGAVADRVAALRGRYPGVTVEVDAPDSVRIDGSDGRLLDILVANLLENAAEHNDASEPRIEVAIDVVEGGELATLTVADNGPAIPEHEREVLDAARETSLDHGSGLGLWTVNWCVRRLGGSLRFERRGDRGNAVTVELPTQPSVVETAAPEPGRDRPSP